MPKPVPPVKTPLGIEEMRSRSNGLNQRHRTMLFLVDGRRPLSEVLALALQAGARTSHFEDLVHMGMVELSLEGEAVEPMPSQPGALDSRGASTMSGVLSVDLELTSEPSTGSDPDAVLPDPPRPRPPLPSPPVRVTDNGPRSATMATGLARSRPAGSRLASRESVDSGWSDAAVTTRPGTLDSGASSRYGALSSEPGRLQVRNASETLLQQVRDLLIDTLRVDAPLFSAVTLVRVHRAQSTKDLITLVWEIERHLGSSRKRQRELKSLHQARDLLGMGNTQVSLDSALDRPDTE